METNKKYIISGIIAALLIMVCIMSVKIIPTGYTGVRMTFGQVNSKVVSSGLNFKIPLAEKIIKINNKQQDEKFSEKVWGETNERTAVYMAEITVTYRINAKHSSWIVSNVTDYKKNLIPQTLIASALKASSKTLSPDDVTNRSKIEPLALTNIQASLDEKYGKGIIDIVKVVINDMDFEDSYKEAIAQKQIAQQEYEKKQIENKQTVEAAEAAAKKKTIDAQADADATKIKASATAEANKKINDSISKNLNNYKMIEKWNGKLPQVSGSDGTIINFSDILEKDE